MKRPDPAPRLAELERFFSAMTSLPMDDAAAYEYGRIRAHLELRGTPIGSYDMLIASIALANDLTVVTHNTAEFGRVPGLAIEDWQA
jgi:tRNA(fMet)-specific endonuclease VapC